MPERMIAELCSPTLSGVKCANLFNCAFESKDKLIHDVMDMNQRLHGKGLHMMILSYPSKNRALIYIFRPCMLQKELNLPETRSLMETLGYKDHRMGACLNVLCNRLSVISTVHSLFSRSNSALDRLSEGSEFPHEIGCFLGYPIEDVRGFMNQKPCIFHGVWKVYGNVDRAKELFDLYDSCTKKNLALYDEGVPIEKIAIA